MIQANIRQWLWPKMLRIRPTGVDSTALLAQLIRASKLASREVAPPGSQREKVPDPRFLARVATHLWRLKARLVDQQSGAVRPELERAYRHFEAAWDEVVDAGVCVIDPVGQPFDPGMTVKALEFQPVRGLTRKIILQTLKPSVFLNQALIQMGEVIVGVPDQSDQCTQHSNTQESHDQNDD